MIYVYFVDDDDSRAKEQEMCPGPNSDMIINLPDNVIDEILVRLPILDAVRTSVLSTKWRYKWTTITQLVFHDNQLVQLPSPNNNNSEDKLTNFIDQVLQLHSGFILKFELSNTCLPISFSMIDAWILFLSRKNIKELVLKFFTSGCRDPYKLPTCFFSAQQQISTLELQRCVLKPPPTFTGFSYLKSLYLDRTAFDSGGFEFLISKCPVLERLTSILVGLSKHLSRLDKLNICSPNLKYLSLCGPSDGICFENTPLLSDVYIFTSYIDVVKVLSSLPNLRKCMLGLVRVSKVPEKLPFTCHHLDNLLLKLNFECVNHMCVALCLLNSSPNLQELHITCHFSDPYDHIGNFWEKRTHIDWKLSRLQVVKIENFDGVEFKAGLEFIKLLLANLPMLEMLSIRFKEQDILDRDRLKLLKELLIFPYASPKAKIKFSEHHEK